MKADKRYLIGINVEGEIERKNDRDLKKASRINNPIRDWKRDV
jgi:hypothetical protein